MEHRILNCRLKMRSAEIILNDDLKYVGMGSCMEARGGRKEINM